MVPSLSHLGRTSADLMVRRLRSSPWHQWLRLSIGCALARFLANRMVRGSGSSPCYQWLRLSIKHAFEDGVELQAAWSGAPGGTMLRWHHQGAHQ